MMNFGIELLDLLEGLQPVGRIHVVAVHERNAAVLHNVAGEQHAVGLDHHHHVARRMRGTRIDQHEAFAAEVERRALAVGDVGWHHPGVAVDPGKERLAALIEPLIGPFVGNFLIALFVFAGPLLGDDDAGLCGP